MRENDWPVPMDPFEAELGWERPGELKAKALRAISKNFKPELRCSSALGDYD